jgi:hypothetical protein
MVMPAGPFHSHHAYGRRKLGLLNLYSQVGMLTATYSFLLSSLL